MGYDALTSLMRASENKIIISAVAVAVAVAVITVFMSMLVRVFGFRVVSAVAYRGVEGNIRPGRHSEWAPKKEKNRKNGKRKKTEKERKKENMGEYHSKTKMELSAAAPVCTQDLTFWRPKPFWRGRVVWLYVILHRARKCIGVLYIMAPFLRKSTYIY